jgi:1-acyl-sn-glycerol-3-phosphate acyltransferase
MGPRIAHFIANLILRLTSRLIVNGIENVPFQDSFVMASNHIGRLDAILIYAFTRRRDVIMLAAEKYRKTPLISWLARQLDVVWVDRFNADFSAVRETLNRLKKGGVLVLAPEGTRSSDGKLQPGRAGASYLAAKAGVPILPVALIGSDDEIVKRNLRRLKRTTIIATVGPAFTLPPLRGKDRDALLAQYTDEIMCQIAALLPPERRGAYADHPRLLELLAQETVEQIV